MTSLIDDDAKTIGRIGLARDISERKRAERALTESEQELRLTVSSTTDGIWKWNFLTNELFFSPQYYTMLGYEPDEFPASYESWESLIHPDDLETTLSVAGNYLKTKPDTYENEFRMKTKSGYYRWIHAKARVVERAGNGEPVRMIGNHQDITEAKQAEETLRESEKRLGIILDSIQTGVLVIDVETRTIVDVNPAAMKIIGAPKEQIIGQVCHNYICPAEKGACPILDLGQKVDNSERTLIKANGEEAPILKTVTPILLGGKECLLDSFFDLTENKKLETQLQQAQKMEAIGTLAGGIAHDFNNILGAIILLSELSMLETPEGSSLHRHIEKILEAGMRAKGLVQQILAFSRQRDQERISMSISPIINEVLKFLRSSLPSTIKISHHIKKDLGLIEGDPTQIHQVVMNLCTNAEHSMREKGGVLDLKLERVDVDDKIAVLHHNLHPGPHIRLEVKDTGYGIEPATMERIFDPYFTTKGVGEGTGLGLAVVQGIVHKHGGAITVESEVGKGTTFEVFFPVIEGEKKEIEEKGEAPLPTGTEHILFIDDEEVLAEVGKEALEHLGYEVIIRTSSTEALELFKAKPGYFDLVITDMSMPNMTGEQLSRELMKIRPELPIILCTGFSHIISKEKAHEIGIKAFVMKPLVRKDLAETVRRVLDQAGASRLP